LASGASTADRVGVILTKRYDGQQNFPCTPHASSSILVTPSDEVPDDPGHGRSNLADMVSVDNLGRRWKVISTDHVALDYAIADYWADVNTSWGLDLDPSPAQTQTANGGLPSGGTAFRLLAGTTGACGGITFGAESRVAQPRSGLVDERQAFVEVFDGGSSSECSGTLVDGNFVLTAEHCVDQTLAVNLVVTTASNVNIQVLEVVANGRLNLSSGQTSIPEDEIRKDWALLKLASSASETPMLLSRDSKVVAGTRRVERVGNDGFWLDTTSGRCRGGLVHHPEEPVIGTRSGALRTEFDASSGGSGGGMYRIRGSQNIGRLLGVLAVENVNWSGGPRISEFRDVVLACISD